MNQIGRSEGAGWARHTSELRPLTPPTCNSKRLTVADCKQRVLLELRDCRGRRFPPVHLRTVSSAYGLQIRVPRFNSARRLHLSRCVFERLAAPSAKRRLVTPRHGAYPEITLFGGPRGTEGGTSPRATGGLAVPRRTGTRRARVRRVVQEGLHVLARPGALHSVRSPVYRLRVVRAAGAWPTGAPLLLHRPRPLTSNADAPDSH